MNDGLWIIEFWSPLGLFGKGIMVVDGERVLGGDFGYYYSGQCKFDNGSIKGEINVIRFDPSAISVFGDVESFTLSLLGKMQGTHFTGQATSDDFPDLKMEIKGSKREDL